MQLLDPPTTQHTARIRAMFTVAGGRYTVDANGTRVRGRVCGLCENYAGGSCGADLRVAGQRAVAVLVLVVGEGLKLLKVDAVMTSVTLGSLRGSIFS